MARPKKQLTDAEAVKMRDVEAYTHDDKKRTNNPPVGMAQHDKAEEKVKGMKNESKEMADHHHFCYLTNILSECIRHWQGR